MKAKWKAGLVMVVLSAAVMGCSEKNEVVNYQETSEVVTDITFFGNKYEPENVTVIEEIITDFMELNPDIRVSYESLKGAEYYEALKKRIVSGKCDDVFMVNHDIMLELKDSGQFEDLSELSTISTYTERMLSQMEEDGKIYWVPTTVSAFGLYCNTSILEEHGQEIPETLQEWRTVCNYFVQQDITPMIANNDISLKTLAIGEGFYSVYMNGQQKETFDRLNQGEEVLSTYLASGFLIADEFIENGYIDAEKALHTEKTSDDLQEFVKGESPFMLTGAWAAGRVKGMKPDFEFEVVPYPVVEDGPMVVINADTRLSVNAAGKNTDAAMKFVEFFTQAENIQKFADQQSSFSPLENGGDPSVREMQRLVACYQAGRSVIGSDALLELPIWELTARASEKLLSGEGAESVSEWVDQQVSEERGAQ